MPIPSIPDETPAWIKGDLPAEASEVDTEPSSTTLESAAAPAPGTAPEPPQPVSEPAPKASEAVVVETAELDPGLEAEISEALAQTEASVPAPAAPELESAPEPALPETPSAGEAVEPATSAAEAAPVTLQAPELLAAAEDHRSSPELGPVEPAATAPAPPEPPVVEDLSLEAQIESLLFVADGAVTVGRLSEALEVSSREVESALTVLGTSYRQRGLSLQRFRDKVQMTTSPSAAARVERFLGLAAASPLSRAALETLAIVAYQQPVTRPQLEAVRGVNSDSVIKNLLSKGLIEESGRAEGPGRPVLYSTTPEFMQHFGLASLADLPPLSLPGPAVPASHEGILKG